MGTNAGCKKSLGILAFMLIGSLSLTINVWTGRDRGESPYTQPALAQGVSFADVRLIPAGVQPRFVVTEDFNEDGALDLAVANAAGIGVTVFLGNGQGSFARPRFFALPPGALAIGDFNRDGAPDLAVTQGTSQRVAVLLGDGQGDFGSPIFFGTGRAPSSIAIGDFNGDDLLDVVTTDIDSGTVSVLINTTSQ